MRKTREILRLVWLCSQSRRDTARTCGVGKSTVDATINRATAAGLSWPLPLDLDDEALERRLYPPVVHPSFRKLSQPDWQALHDELATKDKLSLMLLWQEYKEGAPTGYQYSQFCELYRQWRKKLDLSMRQEHRGGEKFFVDYSGQTLPIVDASTGEIRQAQVFVGVMGGSNQTYVEATWTQSLPDWTGSHARAFAFLGAVPRCLVPDNLRSAVTKSCRYEPDLNPTYAELADHYGTAVVPARVRHPKDKAKVEGGVLIAQRFILASLRNRTFFSLAEANAAIRERLILLNNRPFRKLPGCRQSRFEEVDLPAMLPLPATPYQYAQWKKARVHIDYHVELEGHFYSVPHRLVKEQTELRCTETIVECFYKGNRVSDWKILKKVLKQDRKEFSVKDIGDLIRTALLNDGRCRHMVWEFRKRMAQMIDAKETALHLNTLRAWKSKPLYSIPAEYGDVEDFRPILEKEVVDIKDAARRAEVLDAVIQQMASDRTCESVAADETEVGAEYERFLEDESYRDEAGNDEC
jgi:transposase